MMFDEVLINTLQQEVNKIRSSLSQMRQDAQEWGRRPDWPWNVFVTSYATNGNSRHWIQKIEPAYDTSYSWDALSALNPSARNKRLAEIANPRWGQRLVIAVQSTYSTFQEKGGPQAIGKEYRSQPTAHALIKYLKTYSYIGDKYARNIPMDTCDDIMKDHFAIDSRINGLLEHWGFKETSYKKKEDILRTLAQKLDVDSWTLDRLLYNKASALNPKKAPPRSKHGCRHAASKKKHTVEN